MLTRTKGADMQEHVMTQKKWNDLPGQFVCVIVDKKGYMQALSTIPRLSEDKERWTIRVGTKLKTMGHVKIAAGEWRNSLQIRPGYDPYQAPGVKVKRVVDATEKGDKEVKEESKEKVETVINTHIEDHSKQYELKRSKKMWTTEEDELLVRLYKRESPSKIARRLQRTEKAIALRYLKLRDDKNLWPRLSEIRRQTAVAISESLDIDNKETPIMTDAATPDLTTGPLRLSAQPISTTTDALSEYERHIYALLSLALNNGFEITIPKLGVTINSSVAKESLRGK